MAVGINDAKRLLGKKPKKKIKPKDWFYIGWRILAFIGVLILIYVVYKKFAIPKYS